VWVFDQVQHFDIIKLNIQVLIDRLEDTTDADIVLEFNGDRLVGQGFEEAIRSNLSVSVQSTWACAWGNLIPKEKHGCGGLESLEG
jgi:hypothetical protein